jgi:uncharacterized repeat protein (TIGR02543 family)
MPIKLKTGDSSWSTLKKVWGKTGVSTWSPAKAVFAKLATGWQQIWPGDTPAVSLTDPIDIRLTGYNGARAVSPEYINTVLYGNDGSFTGTTPITISNRKMYISEDNTGTSTRYLIESVDKYDVTSNSEANIGYKRYMADGWWLFYQLTATNISGDTIAYSPPIKLIRQIPTASTYTLAEDYSLLPTFATYTFDVTVSDLWYKAADLSRSYVVWWENTTTSPGGTQLQKTYLNQISNYSTTRSGSYSEYNGTGTTYSSFDIYTKMGEPTAGKYIVAELVLVNSYTDHYNITQSYYRSSGTQAAFGSVSILDSENNSALDRRDNLPVSASFAHVVNVMGVNASTSYRVRYRIYNNQASTNIYYNPDTGASGSSGMWKTFSNTGGDDGSSYISDITSTSANSVTLTDYYWIDETKFPPVTYTDSIFGAQYPKWALEVEISAVTNGVRTYAWPGLNYNSENLSPASDLSISATPASGAPPLSITFNGSTTPVPNLSGYRAYPRAYKINWGDGTGDSGWQYFSSGYNNTYTISHTYSSAGTYYPTIITMPYNTINNTTVNVISRPTAPSYLTASTDLSDGVQLNWQNTGANYYEIYWGSTQGGGPVNQSSYADFGQLNEITTNSYKDTTIAAGATRYYRVRARNNSTATGEYTSDWTPTYGANGIVGTRVLITPSVPTGLSGYGNGTGNLQTITLNWNSASNAAKYELYYNGTGTTPSDSYPADFPQSGSSDITSTTFTTPYQSFSAGTTYYWWVRSVSSGGVKSAWSSRATVVTNSQLYTVTWAPNGGSVSPTTATFTAGGYVVAPTPTRAGYTLNGWYDTSALDWNYFVSAGNLFYPPSRDITMIARWSVAVSAPTNSTAPTLTPTSIAVGTTLTAGRGTWNNTPTSYDVRIYRGTQFVSTGETLVASGTGTSVTYTVTQADYDSGQRYFKVYVNATNSGGSSGFVGGDERGPIATPLAIPSTPTGLSATTNRTTDVFISWNASAGATTYEIWWGGQPSDSSPPDFYPGSATYYFDSGIPQGSSRTYYVRARNAAGASPWSGGVSGTRTNPVVVVNPPTGLSINLSYSSGPSWSGSWSASGATSYSWSFYTASDSSGSNMTFRSSGSGTSMSYSGGSQIWGKVYVTATNSGGSISGESAWT